MSRINVFTKVGLVVLAAAVVFISCSKDQSVEPNQRHPIMALGVDVPFNPANPYDSAGVYHNMGLDYIFAHAGANDTTWWLVVQNCKQSFIDDVMTDGTPQDTAIMMWDNVSDFMSTVDTSVNFSDTMMAFTDDNLSWAEIDFIHRIGFDIKQGETGIGFAATAAGLAALEDSIVNYPWSNGDGYYALNMISVAKYSLYYWHHFLLKYYGAVQKRSQTQLPTAIQFEIARRFGDDVDVITLRHFLATAENSIPGRKRAYAQSRLASMKTQVYWLEVFCAMEALGIDYYGNPF